MTIEANFYKISQDQFAKFFGKLLESIIAKENKVLLYSNEESLIQELDNMLWMYAQLAFLPHGTHKDESIKPFNKVYITNNINDNPIDAKFAAFFGLFTDNFLKLPFQKLLFFYDNHNKEQAKNQVKLLKEQEIKYSCFSLSSSQQWVRSEEIV